MYNSQTGLFSTIVKPVYECLFNNDFDSLDNDIINSLKEKRIIVDDNHQYDYYYLCRQNFLNSFGSNTRGLGLVIAPTTGCNFACPYCFEGEKDNKVMTSEVIDDLILFIKSYKETSHLNITWYGGEPLNAFGLMKEIVKRIKDECHQKIASQSIITNGYLITDEVIKFMRAENFNFIQITFDGVEEHHNKTRFLKGSFSPTFSRIMSNVDRLYREMPEKCKISLRININKDNEQDYAEMYKLVNDKYPNQRISVYPGFIRESNKDNSRMCYKSLTGKSMFDFFKKVEAQGLKVNYYPKRKDKGCMICSGNDFVIGPEGELYKCWNDFNHPDRIVGYLKDKKMTNTSLIGKYSFEATIYSDPKCKDCKLFPICDGGCGWFRYQNTFENKNYQLCPYLKNEVCLEECLIKGESSTGQQISVW